jgi:hypothetical protein
VISFIYDHIRVRYEEGCPDITKQVPKQSYPHTAWIVKALP